MTQREPGQIAFVLHARDYGESSQILEVLTRDRGRVSLMHKGARRASRGATQRLGLFSRYRLGWSGRSQLKTLRNPELEWQYRLPGEALAAGFYINELVWYLTRHEDQCTGIFLAYQSCIEALSSMTEPLDVCLRRFESSLLDHLGYGVSWQQEAGSGEPIEPSQAYYFHPEEGFSRNGLPGDLQFNGSDILALGAGDFSQPNSRRLAKRLFRLILDQVLQGRELRSRSMVQAGG